jgi:hypothetical protein
MFKDLNREYSSETAVRRNSVEEVRITITSISWPVPHTYTCVPPPLNCSQSLRHGRTIESFSRLGCLSLSSSKVNFKLGPVLCCTCDVTDPRYSICLSWSDRSSCWTLTEHVRISTTCPLRAECLSEERLTYLFIYRIQYSTHILHTSRYLQCYDTHSTRTQAPGVPACQLELERTKGSLPV